MHDMPMDLTNNTYAALQLADELENLEVHPFTKTNKNDNGDKEEESIKYPLVWIDLEMTGTTKSTLLFGGLFQHHLILRHPPHQQPNPLLVLLLPNQLQV